MKNKLRLRIPVTHALRKLGGDISDARRRRRITIQLMSERAGISKVTVMKIEKGDSGTSIGGYASVLFILGMSERLGELVDVSKDKLGLRLEDERLPKRVRLPKQKSQKNKTRNNDEQQ